MRLLPLITLLAAAGCAAVPAGDGRQPVSVHFALTSGGQPASCGAPLGPLGTGKVAATLHDARFYVQDVALIGADGTAVPVALPPGPWQTATTALLDFEDASGGCRGGTPATNRVVTGTVPAGRYSGLAFTVGVPPALNHTSTEQAPPPLDIAAMGWSWQAGRKFMKLEVDPAGGVRKPDGSRAATWFLHLGSTGCTGNPATGETVACAQSNRVPVTLADFDLATQRVRLDLATLFAGSDLARDQGAAVGCMSGPTDADCPPVFARLGLATTGTPVEPGRSPAFTATARP